MATKKNLNNLRKTTNKILQDVDKDETSIGPGVGVGQEQDFISLKNELNTYKAHVEGLKNNNSRLIEEKKSIDDLFETYNNLHNSVHRREIYNLKSTMNIMRVG
jgi:hypothetical protein